MDDHVVATHELLFGELADDSDLERRATADAILAALDAATAARIQLDRSLLAEEYPDLAASVGSTFRETTRPDGSTWYVADPVTDEARRLLADLLSIDTWHRYVALETVQLVAEGEPFLEYNGDHRYFRVDGTVAEGAPAALATVFEGHDAGLLPAEPLAEWRVDDTTYRIDPPNLCVESAGAVSTSTRCYDLSKLSGVSVDDEARRIHLRWDQDDDGGVTGLVAGVVEAVGGKRPRTLTFPDETSFESAKEAIDRVSETLGL